jgi:hypothetical protein
VNVSSADVSELTRYCMGYTPEPSTVLTLRDYESESIEGESYGRVMKSQARAILPELKVPAVGTNCSAAFDNEGVPA